ncbi:beta-1,4-N-acetylglucosaminyltransferase [Nematocida sp. AWRm78]|nr:beta-1,4-N-acetylglucosaminyltransferase [Nematocida sp. AWRm79]KAI5183664.1 beta-1,4-N-acetylglucosaminyltransferase [Nematocida sp. AWRm78]
MQEKLVPLIVLGGGGHTQEIIEIMKKGPEFSNVSLICSPCDTLSVNHFINEISPMKYSLYTVPRPNMVLAPYSLLQIIHSLMVSFLIVFRAKSDFLICNGPGISVPIVIAYRIIFPFRRIFYIESMTRTKSLSITGKIVQYIASTFIVQSKELSSAVYPYRTYHNVFTIKCINRNTNI